jgi:hypothetical protein
LFINEQKGYEINIAENLTNIGITYSDLKKYSLAFINYRKGLESFKRLNKMNNVAQVEFNIAELYRDAPDSFFINQNIPLSQKTNLIIELLKSNIDYGEKTGELESQQFAWEALSGLYEQTGDFKNAFYAMQKAKQLRDSIVNESKIVEITQQKEKFEYEKKEAILNATYKANLKQKQTERNALLGGSSILIIGGLVSFFFYKRKREAVTKQQEAELKHEITETEMKALRAQMNPHFMFNSLNSIGDYISHNKTEIATDYLARFAKLMRLVLENSEKKEVTLADDLKALELYMQLEALRMNHKFSYEIKIDDALDAETTFVPPLLLQPFVENSIWHGIAHKQGNGKITLHIVKEDSMVKCIVEDDGVGRKQAAAINEQQPLTEKKSLGMKITNTRINILNKLKNTSAGVQLTDLVHGTRVELRLPLETY